MKLFLSSYSANPKLDLPKISSPQPWRLRSGLSHQRSAWTTCFPRTASLSAGRKGSNPIATAGGPAPPQDGHAGQGGHIMDTLPLFAPPCGHAALAAPKPLMASRLSTVLSSALCAWPSHPHGAFLPGLPCSRRHQLQVAKISGKRHDHMLRDIEQFLTQQPEIFVEPNFGEYEAAY